LPVTVAELTVTVPPVAVSVPDKLFVLPTKVLLNDSVVGVTLSVTSGATPVPVKETVGLVEALLANEIWPEALPVAAGVNFAV